MMLYIYSIFGWSIHSARILDDFITKKYIQFVYLLAVKKQKHDCWKSFRNQNSYLKEINEKYSTRSFEVILHDNGIVESQLREDWNEPDTVETITEHALLLKEVVDGKRRGILAIVPSLYMKKELINVYNEIGIGQIADALLVNSVGAKVLGNFALKIRKTTYPTRLFTNRKEAEAWLLQIMAEAE